MSLYSKDGVGDLVLLESIDEASILSTLKRRYARDLIYTHIGNVLLSVNPFKEIAGLYSEAQIGQYRGRYVSRKQKRQTARSSPVRGFAEATTSDSIRCAWFGSQSVCVL